MEFWMNMTPDPTLEPLDRLVGTWTTASAHPAVPGVVVHGTPAIEWLEGERLPLHRARTDHPDCPDAISVVGLADGDRSDGAAGAAPAAAGTSRSRMHYFDARRRGRHRDRRERSAAAARLARRGGDPGGHRLRDRRDDHRRRDCGPDRRPRRRLPGAYSPPTGAGLLIPSHVNDGGLWLVKVYFDLSVAQTFQTWTVCETIISVVAQVLTVLLAAEL
jgi:hypothetical protein